MRINLSEQSRKLFSLVLSLWPKRLHKLTEIYYHQNRQSLLECHIQSIFISLQFFAILVYICISGYFFRGHNSQNQKANARFLDFRIFLDMLIVTRNFQTSALRSTRELLNKTSYALVM